MMWINEAMVGLYALGLVAILASLRVIMHPSPIHAILAMIVSLLAVAGIFFVLGAPFVGALQVVVYAGAILVLFVFIIMMLNLGNNDAHEKTWLSSKTWAVPFGLTLIIAIVLVGFMLTGDGEGQKIITNETITPKEVGTMLFTHYALLVEVAAFLLLAALVAAYHLGKKALDDENVSHTQNQQK